MPTSTDIGNSALTRLGEARVSDIADTTNAHARVINAEMPIQRDKLLRTYRWAFAMKRAELAADADAPAWGFDKQYPLPADFLALDEVNDIYVGLDMSDYRNANAAEFALEGRKILTNIESPLKVRYVAQITAAGHFDPNFADCLAAALAYHCCERITQSGSKKEGLKGDLRESIRESIRARAIERPPQPLPDDSWIIGRLL